MDTINLSSDIAGMETLWVIRFEGVYPHPYGEEKSKPQFNILFPSPLNKDRWLVVDVSKNKNDLKTVEKFQKLCQEAKKRSDNRIVMIGDLCQNAEESGQEVDNLAQLLLHFNEIMRRLHRKDTDPPEQ